MTEAQRSTVNVYDDDFGPYDMEGPVQKDMSLLLGSYNYDSKRGIYVMRMQPGAETIAHTHGCTEEFLILEGELIESDGTVLQARRPRHLRTRQPPQLAHRDRLSPDRLRLGPDVGRRPLAR